MSKQEPIAVMNDQSTSGTGTPLVTIAITAFNAEDTIERAVLSALAQEWRPVEILVVDDASSDATVERVATMETQHPEIRLIRHSVNQGVAAARNTLIEHATGEFIVFFDDDDQSAQHRVAAQLGRIKSYEARFSPAGPVICHSARRLTMPDGGHRIEAAMGSSLAEVDLAPNGLAVAERVLTGRPIAGGFGALATCSQAARRDTYVQLGGFDPQFRRSEDTEFAIRAALAGAHFVGIAEPLVEQTMTLSSEKSLVNECQAMLALLDKHREFFGSVQAYSFARRWIELKHHWLAGHRGRFALGLAGLAARAPLQTARRCAYAIPMTGSRAWMRRFHRVGSSRGIAA